ncbi:MAG TPA: hypothetical protein PKZ20_14795 [Rhodocyclaceae bacterium]|nr:hypothetical protein [Rhodocyclaceae bacterium]
MDQQNIKEGCRRNMQDILNNLRLLQKEVAAHVQKNRDNRERRSYRKPSEYDFLSTDEKRLLRDKHSAFLATIKESTQKIAKELDKSGKRVTAKGLWEELRSRGLTTMSDGQPYDFKAFTMYYYKIIHPLVKRVRRVDVSKSTAGTNSKYK